MNDTGSQNHHRYAGLWPRFLALALDMVFLSLFFFPVTKIVKGTWLMTAADHNWTYGMFITDPLCIAFLIIIVLYFILLEAFIGATVGKRIAGVKVIDLNGNIPGLGKSIGRNLLRFVDSLPALNIIGMVLIIQSPQRARFGDRVAGTRVVYKNE
jgi:uncharacterized RDD family membrane protein YckC